MTYAVFAAKPRRTALVVGFLASCAMVMSLDTFGAWSWLYVPGAALVTWIVDARLGGRGRPLANQAVLAAGLVILLFPVALFMVVMLVYASYDLFGHA